MNVAARFLELLAAQGDRPAIHEPNGAIVTFAEIRRRALGLAKLLRQRGFREGDPAVIQVPTGAAFTVTQLAVGINGGVSVLIEPGFSDALYRDRVAAARSKWMLVHPLVLWANRVPGARSFLARRGQLVPEVLPETADLRRIVISKRLLREAEAAFDDTLPVADLSPRTDSAIIFTGGSTGQPKGVRLSHGSIARIVANVGGIASASRTKTYIADNPQQVVFGLVFGNEILVARGPMKKRAAYILGLLRNGKAGAYFGAPYVWMEMMEQAGASRTRLSPDLRAVYLGGAPVTPEFLRRLRAWLHPETRIVLIYGMTEAGPVATIPAEEKLAWTGEGDFVGRVVPGIAVTRKETGELVVAGDALFTGYVGGPERDPLAGFDTGDLGDIRTSADGGSELVLRGRIKDMIIRGGINIYPATLEDGIRAVRDGAGRPVFREIAMIGLWDEKAEDEVVVLAWQPIAGATPPDDATLLRLVGAATGPNATPDHLMRVDDMPVMGRLSKVDKRALRERAAARFGLAVAPRGQTGL
jgi:acyl-CoA synthetase (AMP-forming)/AMP-acid ligase II